MSAVRPSLRVASMNLLNSPTRLEERYRILLNELRRVNADVLCLQEVIVEEQDRLSLLLAQLGYQVKHFGGTITSNVVLGSYTATSGCAVFVKTRDVSFEEIVFSDAEVGLPVQRFGTIPSVVATIDLGKGGGKVVVISSHFAWGLKSEAMRLRQAGVVSDFAEKVVEENPTAIVLHGADLNAVPESSTVRYLRGLDADTRDLSTHWVDAWEHVGSPEAEFTSTPALNQWSRSMAMKASGTLFPELVPNRRIDYLMSYGWVYGRRGSPMQFGKFAHQSVRGLEVSDHAGLFADFLL